MLDCKPLPRKKKARDREGRRQHGRCWIAYPQSSGAGKGSRMAKELDPLYREMTFASTPFDMASWLILEHGERLLVTHDDQQSGSDLHVLDATGVWTKGDDALLKLLAERGQALREEAVKLTAGNVKTGLALMRDARPWFSPPSLDQVRKMAHPAYMVLRDAKAGINAPVGDDDNPLFDITLTLDTKLNADPLFIGTASGVVSLETGKLLPPDQGRRHLVTHRAPIGWEPGAQHPDVDRLFAHLPDAERNWWWQVLGYALRGSPSARIYEVVGPPNGGKSGLMAALTATLGPYAGVASPGLLELRRGAVESDSGLSPGTVAMVPPRRFAIFDEVKPKRLNNKLLKDWSGDGAGVTWRTLHQQPRTDRVTASMFLLCNTGQEARLGMQDAGMQRRLRTLAYPALRAMIDDFNTKRILDPAFQRALLWRLVDEASRCTTGAPPDAPPSVMATTAERIADDVGEIGNFAKRIVRGSGTLTVAEVWSAWCQHNDEQADADAPGGIKRTRLSTELVALVSGLPKPHPYKVDGKNARGWRGWQLLDAVPSADTDDDHVDPAALDALIAMGQQQYRLVNGRHRGDMVTVADLIEMCNSEMQETGEAFGFQVWPSRVRLDGKVVDLTGKEPYFDQLMGDWNGNDQDHVEELPDAVMLAQIVPIDERRAPDDTPELPGIN